MARVVYASLIAFACAASPAAAQISDGDIANALRANAWCTMSYNRVTGGYNRRTARFGDNILQIDYYGEGQYTATTRRELFHWRVQGGRLQLSQDGGSWGDLELDARRNSNGYLILIVDGVEWSQC